MCQSRNSTKVNLCMPRKYSKRTTIKVDKCIAGLVQFLNDRKIHTLGSCCGHGGEQGPSIIVEHEGKTFDIFSMKEVKRIQKYYRKDKKTGLYYIPEVKNGQTKRKL